MRVVVRKSPRKTSVCQRASAIIGPILWKKLLPSKRSSVFSGKPNASSVHKGRFLISLNYGKLSGE